MFSIRFLCYLLPFPLKIINDLTHSTTVKHLSSAQVLSIRFNAPSLEEQRAIATFLDHKTSSLDTIIAKKQRLLELLDEKRRALINQAVTRGLDPDVPMKDSGVEWIGEVPEGWEVVPLKHLAQVRGGVTKGRDLSGEDVVDLPYLRVANVQDGYLKLEEVYTIEIKRSEVERYSLQPGDILMNEGGDNDKLGRGAVWRGQLEPCLHQNHVFAVRPNENVNPDWINLTTQTEYLKFFFMSRAKQSTNLASISSSNIKEAPILYPPLDEQRRILSFVNRETATIDAIADKTRLQLAKLQEYRQALITAAVTGQIAPEEMEGDVEELTRGRGPTRFGGVK